MRATPPGAAHVNRTHGLTVRALTRVEFFANLGAGAHQVLSGRVRVALAECQLHAGHHRFTQGHPLVSRIQADQVANPAVGAKVRSVAEQVFIGFGYARECQADFGQGFVLPFG